MPGTGTLVRALTESLLRCRLRRVAFIFLAAAVIWITIDQVSGQTFGLLILIPCLLVLGGVAALLYSQKAIPLTSLRVLELVLFGAAAVYLPARDYTFIYWAMSQGEVSLALSGFTETVFHIVLLVAVYGMFIPNTIKRVTAVAVSLAATPIAAGLALGFAFPAIAEAMGQLRAGRIAETGFLLTLSAGIAIAGTQIIGQYQSQGVEAMEAGFYQLKERIGSGGMGEVWRAEHHKLVRPAAIKLIRPDRIEDKDQAVARETIRRFEREAQATAALRSPHTVELYDFGVSGDGVFYYVMEYLNGIDLKTLIEKHGPQPPERTIHLLKQVCESLADAHESRMIHRDVKPANIFTCHMGLSYDFVKVLDFGLVKIETDDGDEDTQLTQEGMTAGSPAFMAPEVVTGKRDVDARADLYAVGCVGYWLLTGQYVFPRKRTMAMALDHVTTTTQPPSRRSELSIPAELDRIILKCLAKQPEDRFGSAMELAEALSTGVASNGWDRRHAEEWWKSHYPEV